MAGMEITKPTTRSGYGIGLHEDETNGRANGLDELSETSPTPLDILVKDFLKNIKSDWSGDELNKAVTYLHKIYKKYGD